MKIIDAPQTGRRLALGGVLAMAVSLPAQQLPTTENLNLDAVEPADGVGFSIVFTDSGTGAADYALEYSATVGANAYWTVDPLATVESMEGNQFRATTLHPVEFGAYRVVAYDADNDLTGQFALATVELSESAGGMELLLLFSKPFAGTLNYLVGGTAGTQFNPLSGSVSVNNATTAKISLGLTDDDIINELRFLTLDIQNAGGLVGGANSQALITVLDDDAVWNGQILFDGLELAFEYRQTSLAGVYQATLVSDGSGPLPAGEYPASLGVNPFPATISGINVDAGSSALGEASTITIVLDVQSGLENHRITATEIEGGATVITSYPGKPHLQVSKTGRFQLLKPAIAPSSAEVPLANNND